LYIANSNTNAPLIKGDFSAQTLIMNGKMTVGGSQSPDSTLDVKGGVRFQALLPSNNASDSMLVLKINGGVGFRSIPSGGGSVTSITGGYGLSGGTITTSGTLSVDTSTLSSKYVRVVDTSVFQRKSSAAYTFKANNTNATANATDQTFRDQSSQTYTGTILWNGTAPTGTTNHTYHWTQVGKKVDLRISLVYGTAGATNSQVTLAIPSDCPTPASISGLTANQDMLYQGTGYINSTTSAPTAFCRAYIRNIVASSPDIFLVQTTSISARCAWITITYWTN